MQNLDELYNLIKERQTNPKKGSYTDYLFSEGLDKILKKVGEESTEVIVAAKNPGKPRGDGELVYESADLLYHLCVLWAQQGITFDQIKKELAQREGLMSQFKDRPEIKDL